MFPKFPFQHLLDWYRQNGRHALPWRQLDGLSAAQRAYRVWLSEIYLQQTQAPRVVEFFKNTLQAFPDITSLSKASYEEFFPYYNGLGYYSRAKNLLQTAKIIAEKYNWEFPQTSEELRNLPGIGDYTSEAIRAFAFRIPTLSFDTNLEKVFSRYYFGNRFQKLTDGEKREILEDFLASKTDPFSVNAALMDYANIVSLNVKSKCFFSSMLPGCQFAQTQGEREPEKKPKREVFPLKDAKKIVFLTDSEGKISYSRHAKKYEPFLLDADPDTPHREAIKSYFWEQYRLMVSVRPPYRKSLIRDEAFAFYRVRIQTGTQNFHEFWKNDALYWEKSFEL